MGTPFGNFPDPIGSGAKYPLTVKRRFGGQAVTVLSTGTDRINQSIYTILTTSIGERFELPEFGSALRQILFEPHDQIFLDLLNIYVIQAIQRWEKRITDVIVTVPEGEELERQREQGVIGIAISYTIIQTGQPGNYVYPFYVEPMPIDETLSNLRQGIEY